ncbi:hypothetical protein Pyn_37470 [Prunus yedoensis var. nudiflora]|uniref:Uncharacterized protein n=1 Tax=Prunus yedoensis var. nudiflora TaxID=2094558 RepID=A0A314Y5V7_PRUYE|nr:hypothetical protein Pyn_37470 [Prunus yedoensis var. nudiflora]
MAPCWHLLECDFGISLKRFCRLSVAGGCIHPPKTSLRVPMFFVLGAILMVELLGSYGAGADWWLSLHVVAARNVYKVRKKKKTKMGIADIHSAPTPGVTVRTLSLKAEGSNVIMLIKNEEC